MLSGARCPVCGGPVEVHTEVVIPWRTDTGPVRVSGRGVAEFCCACGWRGLTPEAEEAVRFVMTEMNDYGMEVYCYRNLRVQSERKWSYNSCQEIKEVNGTVGGAAV